MKVTNKEIKMNWRDYEITIPKGTRVTHQTACGYDENYNFINDFSWVPKINGKINSGFIFDAEHYGININKNDIEDIT